MEMRCRRRARRRRRRARDQHTSSRRRIRQWRTRPSPASAPQGDNWLNEIDLLTGGGGTAIFDLDANNVVIRIASPRRPGRNCGRGLPGSLCRNAPGAPCRSRSPRSRGAEPDVFQHQPDAIVASTTTTDPVSGGHFDLTRLKWHGHRPTRRLEHARPRIRRQVQRDRRHAECEPRHVQTRQRDSERRRRSRSWWRTRSSTRRPSSGRRQPVFWSSYETTAGLTMTRSQPAIRGRTSPR